MTDALESLRIAKPNIHHRCILMPYFVPARTSSNWLFYQSIIFVFLFKQNLNIKLCHTPTYNWTFCSMRVAELTIDLSPVEHPRSSPLLSSSRKLSSTTSLSSNWFFLVEVATFRWEDSFCSSDTASSCSSSSISLSSTTSLSPSLKLSSSENLKNQLFFLDVFGYSNKNSNKTITFLTLFSTASSSESLEMMMFR